MKTPAASHGGCAATTTIPAELAVEILALPSHPVGEFTAPGNPDLIVVYCPATPDELTSTPWRCDLPGGHPDRHVVHAHTTPDEVDYWVMWLGNEPPALVRADVCSSCYSGVDGEFCLLPAGHTGLHDGGERRWVGALGTASP